jgi:wyosine [tRNA(Phe)-imidazoG37] synthetase (radical SAM superfamily)
LESKLNEKTPSSVYGPVNSWRLGRSLGIDLLLIDSICSFECVYCQLGKINRVTTTREVFVPTQKVLDDLAQCDLSEVDVITFSGSGEPTLAKNLGEAIREIKKRTGKPAIVLTNATLLYLEEVRAEIREADKIFCKLDAWSKNTFEKFDRPHRDVTLDSVIHGIKMLRKEFSGFLAIQTMLLRALTDFELEEFGSLLREIAPEEVQLNIPTRAIPREFILESRGNRLNADIDHRHLSMISHAEILQISERLRSLTRLPIRTPPPELQKVSSPTAAA